MRWRTEHLKEKKGKKQQTNKRKDIKKKRGKRENITINWLKKDERPNDVHIFSVEWSLYFPVSDLLFLRNVVLFDDTTGNDGSIVAFSIVFWSP